MTAAKKRKRELEVTVENIVELAGKKAKETEKKTNVVTIKTLLKESNASRKNSQEIMKTDVPKQEKEIKEVEKKLKLFN